MVKDYPEVKNACLEQNIFEYGSRSISVNTKEDGKRIYNVWFVVYYKLVYGALKFSCNRDSIGAKSKQYYKEFLSFKEAEDAFYKYDRKAIINQEMDYSYNPL